MIDFRYHLVSIVAVFLALAIGIVLGTSMGPAVTKSVKSHSLEDLRSDNETLRAEQREAQRQSDNSNQVIGSLSPQMVAKQLTGQRIVLVEAPGANEDARDRVADLVRKAGGTITGVVVVQNKFLDPSQDNVIDGLVDQLRPSSLELPKGTPRDRAAAEIADAVVTDKTSRAGQEETSSDTILSGYRDAGYLTTSGNPAARATLSMVLSPQAAYTGPNSESSNTALVSLAKALDAGGRGAVVGGSTASTTTGGMLAALAEDSAAVAKVSTVNNIDYTSGQVVSVYALAAEDKGRTGQYGTAATPVPSPVPQLQGATKTKGKS